MKSFIISLALGLSTSVHAFEFFRGPLSSSLGHSGRAGLDSAESALINPALLPLMKASTMNLYYRDGYLEDAQHSNSMGIGIFDHSEGVWFPGALHYFRLRDTGRAPLAAEGELWHAGLGFHVNPQLALGLSAYRLSYDVAGSSTEQWNGSLGGLFKITPEFGVAYVLDNLAKPGSEVPTALREDLEQSLGFFGAIADMAHMRFDVSRRERHNPKHKMAYMTGIETQSHKYLLVRVGFKRDELRDQSLWTAGFTFNGPRLKVDYSAEKSAERATGVLHSVDLRLPF